MRTLILHIGMAKTGTTTIQRSFHGFRDSETKFLSFKDTDTAVAFHTIFSSERLKSHIHKRFGRTPQEIEVLRCALTEELENQLNSSHKKVIASSEAFTSLTEEDVLDCVSFFRRNFDNVKFIAYIRPPFSYAQSLFQQKLVGGYPHFEIPTPRYRMMFEKFVKNFPMQDFKFVKFDRQSLHDGEIVSDFCKQLNLLNPPAVINSNDGLSLEACCLLFVQNKFGTLNFGSRENALARGYLRRILTSVGHRRFTLDRGLLEKAIPVEDIKWMEQISGLTLHEDEPSSTDAIQNESQMIEVAEASIDDFKRATGDFVSQQLLKADTAHEVTTKALRILSSIC